MEVTGPTVSWHVRKLCDARIITQDRDGKRVRYRLTPVAEKVLSGLAGRPRGGEP
ncbi:MAG: helix-turn-helix domain-containing protein [Methanoregulaceae archaeon]|nr:helix-turn-helix domain-containing protein [Methanoregulaceae archaeon]